VCMVYVVFCLYICMLHELCYLMCRLAVLREASYVWLRSDEEIESWPNSTA
jgi:hypothetical protein